MKLLMRQTESGSKLSIRGKSLLDPVHKSIRWGLIGVRFRPSGEMKDRTLPDMKAQIHNNLRRTQRPSCTTGQTHPVISSLNTNASKIFFLNENNTQKERKETKD
jgi:hypothetical protein